MIVQDQKVQINWARNTKSHYISKGYEFTKFGDPFYVDVNDLPKTTKIYIDVICDYCGNKFKKQYGLYNAEISNGINKCCCINCQPKKLSEAKLLINNEKYYNEFLNLCDKYGFEPISTKEDYNGTSTILKYICPKHGYQEQTLDYIRKYGCCGCKAENTNTKRRNNCIKLFNELCEQKQYLPLSTIDDIQNEGSWYYYVCPKHGIQKIRLRDFKRGHGCSDCRYENNGSNLKLSKETVIDIVESKNNNILLNPDEYVRAIENNLRIQCGSCGNIFTVSLNNFQKNYTGKCQDCNENSFGEAIIHDLLNKYSIEHVRQKRFNDCRDKNTLPFDFYLTKHNIIIEFDGQHHFYPVFGDEAFRNTQIHDSIKDKYCLDHGIHIVRIPYWEIRNIEQILIKELHLSPIKKIQYPIIKSA